MIANMNPDEPDNSENEVVDKSPLDVEGIDLDLTQEEIVTFIHEGRRYSE